MDSKTYKNTPLYIVAETSNLVIQITERLCGDRVDFPLLVCSGVVFALSKYGIKAQIMYGQSAWVEVLETDQLTWAGCWGDNIQFWVVNEYQELIDLNAAVGYRKRAHDSSLPQSKFGPPILWSNELPRFYIYKPEGVAELDLLDDRDSRWYWQMCEEIEKNRKPDLSGLSADQLSFPNEAFLCSGRKILDDSNNSFASYDRALKVLGIPEEPKFKEPI